MACARRIVAGARLAQAEVTHLPLPYQLRHGTGGLFDGDLLASAHILAIKS